MSNVLIGFLAGLGAGAWFYAKMLKQTGNNAKTSLTVAAAGAVIVMFVVIGILGMISG